jgi:Zn-dependent protease with chaperone function
VSRLAVAALATCFLAGCAAHSGDGSQEGQGRWSPALPTFLTVQGEKTTLISELKPGPYEPSSLAIGEEKDLAQQRGEGLGFVRIPPVEHYLSDVRSKLVAASGVTAVPGRVMILATPAFAAYSTPDGNIYVSMGWFEYLENADEVTAILAHELSHVLLKHHTSDLVSTMQHKAQALHEIALSARATVTTSKTPAKNDARALASEELAADVTDRLVLPAWSRRQEREADLLGADLLARAAYSPGAMVTMLEKLQAWEGQNKEAEDTFWERLGQTAQKNPGEALGAVYQRVRQAVSESHPKTDERLNDVAEYLERHYGDAKPVAPTVAPWKHVASQPEVSQVLRNYQIAFSAKKNLDAGKASDAYALAKTAAGGRTASDAYPNWILWRAATSLGRRGDALEALRRAINSPEPVPEIYEAMISTYEQAGNIGTALTWTEQASTAFGDAPRWRPTKIRLLRKAGRTAEASALTLDCSVSAPDARRLCQKANETPAGRPQR